MVATVVVIKILQAREQIAVGSRKKKEKLATAV
jgi:hypothetical protein